MNLDNEYDLSDEEAEAILAAAPDEALVTDYLAGVLDEREQLAFRERLRQDPAFQAIANPLIEAWGAVPPFRPRMTDAELQEGWQRFQSFAGMVEQSAPPTRDATRQRRLYRLMLAAMVLLAVIGIPLAGWIGYSMSPRPTIHAAVADLSNETVALGRSSSAVLTPGSRLIWYDRPDAEGRREMNLFQGNGTFVLSRLTDGVWVVLTPSGRLSTNEAVMQVDARDPQLTFVRVDRGQVTIDAPSARSAAPLVLGPGERGVLVHGQAPARAN